MAFNNGSEIAEFRHQQAMQEQAAALGLRGLAAGVSRHVFIEARMQRGAEHILQFIQQGKHEEAQALMATRSWGQEELEGLEEERYSICHITIPS